MIFVLSESMVVLSMYGWHVLFHPLIQTFSRYFSRLKRVCHTQTLTSTERHTSSLHSHLWVQLSTGSAFPQPNKNDKFLRFFIIFNFKIFSLYQLIRDSSTIRMQMLTKFMSISSYSPKVSAFGTLIASTKVFSLITCKTR